MALKIGIFVQVMNVIVTKFTYLFLAWLREYISEWSILSVTGVMTVVGLTLFLLPPVPGVPIYFMSGLMLVKVCEVSMGLGGAIAYCIALGVFLKLVACSLQQKMIGGIFGKKVAIRQMVGVNSVMIRTMKVILSKPGLSMDKCAILVGGPDWPTSVLCGIMGLDLLPILVGTLPVISLITPTVLSGVLVYLSGPPHSYAWASTVGTVCISVTGMAQSGSLIMATFYLEKAMVEEKEAIALIPVDEEVVKADEEAVKKGVIYHDLTKWAVLPKWIKFNLLTALVGMTISCYLCMIFTDSCFEVFEMSDTIAEALNGDAMSLFKPGGWLAIGLFVFGTLQLIVFNSYANGLVAKYEKEQEKEGNSAI
jgi:hypothetical protein